jgi:hypothetical protein
MAGARVGPRRVLRSSRADGQRAVDRNQSRKYGAGMVPIRIRRSWNSLALVGAFLRLTVGVAQRLDRGLPQVVRDRLRGPLDVAVDGPLRPTIDRLRGRVALRPLVRLG